MQTPDMITFHCPNCSMKLQVPSQMAGVTGPCPQCSASISAPQPGIQPIAAAPLPQQQAQQATQQATQQPVQQQAQQQQPVAQNPQRPLQQDITPQARENPAARAERPNAERPAQESPVARERARQRAEQPRQKPQPNQKPRARWMRVIFPLAFLIVAVALVLAVLQAVGVFNVWDLETSKKELISTNPDKGFDNTPLTTGNEKQPATDSTSGNTAPSVNPDDKTPSEVAPEGPTMPVIKYTPEDGEFPELKLPASPPATISPDTGTSSTPPAPPITPPPSPPISPPTPPIIQAATPQYITPPSPPKAGFLANQNLNLFLAAKTLDERMALMSKSKYTREELMTSCLAGPLRAVKSVRMVEMVPRAEDNMTQYLYFVSFEDPDEDQQRLRIVMQVVERPGTHAPRVHGDAFIEHYEKKFAQYAKHPNNDVTTFHCIAESRMAALSKDLPKELRESMARLVIKSHPRGSTMFDAYLNKNSPLMEHIGTRKDFPYTESRFCVLSFRWNTTNPSHPYIELNDIVSQGWER